MNKFISGLFASLLFSTSLAFAQQATTQSPGILAKTASITRDLTVASGSVAYTICGFRPRALLATGSVAGMANYTVIFGAAGNDLTSSSNALYAGGTSTAINSGLITAFDATTTNFVTATVASYDALGFTLNWTRTNSPTGTLDISITCLQ